jgi:hypothetical protein
VTSFEHFPKGFARMDAVLAAKENRTEEAVDRELKRWEPRPKRKSRRRS